ncbi:MAG TPA: non-canonical purine NTP pyrophosphatase [Solirubrobacteraceae bacterium]|nr:non-canonical purine NTP pyrophosphatase [Solirubrobacteraceae bacterium]
MRESRRIAMRLVLATRNRHKQREFARLLPAHELDPLPDEAALPPEQAATFADNALVKARAAAVATGRPAIADDSGIAAAALGGRPGTRSARYAGENATDAENLDKLRSEAPAGSELTYVCALAYSDPVAQRERVFEGRCEGVVAADPRGDNGFGYDPIFLPGESLAQGRTMAELADTEKDSISHRARAARALDSWLRG